MTFFRRLRLYLVGVIIGIIVVYFMLLYKRDRPSWLPQGRILEQITASKINFSEKAICNMQELNINESTVKNSIIKNGSVIFSKSDTKRKPCPIYYIENNQKDKIFIRVEVCDSISNVMWVSKNNIPTNNNPCK